MATQAGILIVDGVECPVHWNGTERIVSYPSGELMLRGHFADDTQRVGVHEAWFENGALRSRVDWRLGVRHGNAIYYYQDGVVRSQGRYARGYMDGFWFANHPDGSRESEGSYTVEFDARGIPVAQLQVGLWRYWTRWGATLDSRSGLYENGVRIRGL